MLKTQVEPRAASEWFHSQVLNILWPHFMVYKSIDHRRLPSTCFVAITWKKLVRAGFTLFSVEKARVT